MNTISNPLTWELPSAHIYMYASGIRKNHPEIWKLGGNIFGNQAFINLGKVVKRGYWQVDEEQMYKRWVAFRKRHANDFRAAGVVANLKWLAWVNSGEEYVRELIDEEIQKAERKRTKA